jgi:NodT family efflux transporter outer membrane factor (OMF) lipoprotein
MSGMPNLTLLRPFRLSFVCLVGVVLLSSCAAFHQDQATVPETQKIEPSIAATTAIEAQWWKQLGDAQLNRLVDQALEDSPSIKTADARMQNAKALIDANRSSLFPQMAINTQLNRQELSRNYIFPPSFEKLQNYGIIALTFDWSLDVWGKQKYLLDGAKYRFVGATAQLDAAKKALSNGIVSAYIEYDYAYKALQLAQKDSEVSDELLAIAQQRYQRGLIDQVLLQQRKVDNDTLHSQVGQARKAIELWRHQLAVLVGQGPSFGDQLTPPRLSSTTIIANTPKVIPSDLVARRPDLQGLLAQIEANKEDLKAARLDYLPSFNLAANVGYQAFGFNNLLNQDSQIFSIGPVINLPIFNGGKIDANVAVKNAIKDQAIADYHEQLLTALRESADGISAVNAASGSLELASQSNQSAQIVLDIYQKRYRAGLLSKDDLEKALLEYDRQTNTFYIAQKNLLNAYVQLIQALGGGYIAKDASVQLSSQP